jgi:hypothetical protein
MIRKTNDSEAVIALRIELNREHAYVRCTKVRINNGAEVKDSTKWTAGIKWQNVVSIRKALKKIENIKPLYKWDYVTI